MSSRLWLMMPATLVALAGCNTANKHIGEEDPFFGEAVKYNAAVQTINPDPVYPEGGAEPGDSGVKGAKAVQRYRNDEVNARHRSQSRPPSATTGGPL